MTDSNATVYRKVKSRPYAHHGLKMGYAVFDENGRCYHVGSFELSEPDQRSAFARRANEAQAAGHEVRTFDFRKYPDRYRVGAHTGDW